MLPFPFKSTDPATVAVLNEVMGRSRRIPFKLRNVAYQLEFISQVVDYRAAVHFNVRTHQENIIVGLNTLPPSELLGGPLEEIALQDCPPELKGSLLECWCEDILQSIETAFHLTCTIDSFELQPQATEPQDKRIFFLIYAPNNQFPVLKGHFDLSDVLLKKLSHNLKSLPVTPWTELADVTFRGRFEIGETFLSIDQFKSLRMNDVILADHFFLDSQPHLQMFFEPNLTFNLKYQQNRATIMSMHLKNLDKVAYHPAFDFRKADVLEASNNNEDNFDDDLDDEDEEPSTAGGGSAPQSVATPSSAPASSVNPTTTLSSPAATSAQPLPAKGVPTAMSPQPLTSFAEPTPPVPSSTVSQAAGIQGPPIEQIAVHLTFQVGEKQLPFAELKNLKPGYIFELENALEKPVTICANGTSVGIGELLQIEKRIGVRILDWGRITTS